MSKQPLTVFLCTGKDCRKAWGRLCDCSPGKWLKRQVEKAGLPYKLNVVETCCMDHCEEAACLCCVVGGCAGFESFIRSHHDADRILAGMRSYVENAATPLPKV